MNIIIDNYDSFTYNLVQYIGSIDSDLVVFKNDEVCIDKIISLNPSHIIISPGPGRPEDSGVSIEIIKMLFDKIPILGVCLGHQAIAQVFNGNVVKSGDIFHGKSSDIFHNSDIIFDKVNSPFRATRYHSLIVDRFLLPRDFDIIAWTKDDTVMGVKHKVFPLYGFQFHPESILTEFGHQLINNFLNVYIG